MNKKTLGTGRFLHLVEADGWEYVDRVIASGVVAVAAVTDDARLILVEQFRGPVGCPVIELPTGLCGDDPGAAGEPLAEAGCRELLEETGYEVRGGSKSLELLYTVPSSAGLTSEVVSIFGARGARKVAAGGGLEGESIVVHTPSLDEAADWLLARSRAGLLLDPKVFIGLHFALRP
jgi:ADP-ribose pyrophosphatase